MHLHLAFQTDNKILNGRNYSLYSFLCISVASTVPYKRGALVIFIDLSYIKPPHGTQPTPFI